jgi:hypothetical protein
VILPHVLAPHLLWVVTSLLLAAASGGMLAESLGHSEEPVWGPAVAFVMWCVVCVLSIWVTP